MNSFALKRRKPADRPKPVRGRVGEIFYLPAEGQWWDHEKYLSSRSESPARLVRETILFCCVFIFS